MGITAEEVREAFQGKGLTSRDAAPIATFFRTLIAFRETPGGEAALQYLVHARISDIEKLIEGLAHLKDGEAVDLPTLWEHLDE